MNPSQPQAKKACDKCRLRKIKIRQQQGWRSAEQLQTPTISPGRSADTLPDGDQMQSSWDMLGCLPHQPAPPPDAWTQSEDDYLMPASQPQPAPPSNNAFDDPMFSLLARPPAPSAGSLHQGPPSLPDPASLWPLGITDENLIRWIDVYFERLYPTLPILKRSSIFARLLSQEHRTNPDFGAMLLALSAFSLIQPVRISEWSSASSRENMVNFMLTESVKMRASVDFGENPSLDAILTSVFLFACLFQKNQHNAAWFRLKEAVELGSVFGLGRSDCYASCEPEQKQQRLRIYYLLAVTERWELPLTCTHKPLTACRAYALEKKHPITFLGHPSTETRSLLESVSTAAEGDDLGIVIHDEAESNGMLGLLRLMTLFDPIDENFVRCWNSQCDKTGGRCRFLDEQMAIAIYESLTRHSIQNTGSHASLFTNTPPSWFMSATLKDTQIADLMVNEQWLQNRFWNLCLSHKILSPQAEHPALQVFQAVTIAENTLRVCAGLSLSSLEVHGVGLVSARENDGSGGFLADGTQIEKLYCIVESAVAAKRYSESMSYGAQVAALSPHAFNNTSASLSPSDPLIHGFLDLFKKIRAGQHPFLSKLSALVGPEMGVDGI
ncbi:hypothetical protein SLS55_003876 [Diplodia seriata]|uniref:Transcription factor domain-containing protein n=1 Tax=Diplodia seriata TaxID=420778 RepID=A0ABR3CHU1_9PEZI